MLLLNNQSLFFFVFGNTQRAGNTDGNKDGITDGNEDGMTDGNEDTLGNE